MVSRRNILLVFVFVVLAPVLATIPGCGKFELESRGHLDEPCFLGEPQTCRGNLTCVDGVCKNPADGDTETDGDTAVDGDTEVDGDTAPDGDTVSDGDTAIDGDSDEDDTAADGDSQVDGDLDPDPDGDTSPVLICADGICLDPSTGFEWQQEPTGGTMSWDAAIAHCQGLDLQGMGWRSPNISELRTLVRHCDPIQTDGICSVQDTCLSCGIDAEDECLASSCWNSSECLPDSCPNDGSLGCFWPDELNGTCYWYWSSSSVEDRPQDAWLVRFGHGDITYHAKTNIIWIRCVRDGETADGDQELDGDTEPDTDGETQPDGDTEGDLICADSICLDPATGFEWQQEPAGGTMTWDAAINHCQELDLEGTGWRLPNISELRSLVRNCGPVSSSGSCGIVDMCISCGVDSTCLDISCFDGSTCNPPSCADDGGPTGCYWPNALEGTCSMYWSSSEREDFPNAEWAVGFLTGRVYSNVDDPLHNVRCIRGGTAPDGDQELDGDADPDVDAIDIETCSSGPCCNAGQWLEENAPCVSGENVPSCAEEKCTASHECLPAPLVGYCLVEGICAADGEDEPGNECRYCDIFNSPTAWRNKPSGQGCGSLDQCYQGACADCTNLAGCADLADDGKECSEAACNTGTHQCYHKLDARQGLPCGDDSDTVCTNPDSCAANGVCQPNHEPNTKSCNDNIACTHTDKCNGNGGCAGTQYSCNGHGSCKGDNTCTCDTGFGGPHCDQCASGYNCGYPICINAFACFDGVCRDPVTCFQWQQMPTLTGTNFLAAITHCQNLNLLGTGWRLPNISELRSLIRNCGPIEMAGACGVRDVCSPCGDVSACLNSGCASDNCNPSSCADNGGPSGCYWPQQLNGGCADSYWSSSDVSNNSDNAWAVQFYYGILSSQEKGGNTTSVRCVR